MSTQDILKELPRLSVTERELVAKVLHELATAELESAPHSPTSPVAGLHAGAWEIAPDFDEPLPDAFWLGTDA